MIEVPRGLRNSQPAVTKRTRNVDPGPTLEIEPASGSERRSGVAGRRASWQRVLLNAFDPEGGKSPEGEWRQGKRLVKFRAGTATGQKAEKFPPAGANRRREWSRRAERAGKAWDRE